MIALRLGRTVSRVTLLNCEYSMVFDGIKMLISFAMRIWLFHSLLLSWVMKIKSERLCVVSWNNLVSHKNDNEH